MKTSVAEHINQLLFDHECVVVPGFGAFLTRYYPAEINPATHMMRPPSRRVYFNPRLRENDGLLAKSLSLAAGQTYSTALDTIETEVQNWKKQLQTGEKLRLPGIGKLYRDNADRLQFSPSLENNFQRSSYGLNIFRTPAIEREAVIRKNIQKSIDRHVSSASKAEPVAAKKRTFGWAAVLGPFIFAGIVGAAYYAIRSQAIDQWAGMPGASPTPTEQVESGETTAQPAEIIEENPEVTRESAPASAPEESNLPEETAAPEKDEIPVSAFYPFHIVVGSFKEERNASQYLQQLKAMGYDAYLASDAGSFHRVAVGNFASKATAQQALSGVRQNLNAGAWIYRN